jgi:AbiV family abortive infection protein
MESHASFHEAIAACLENAEALLEDVQSLRDVDRHATAFFLAIIAQEECAKAFLLHLVDRGVVPWHPLVERAARDHACKQLLGLVLEHLNPDHGEWERRITEIAVAQVFPRAVADAIALLRHEKIGRWQSSDWAWTEPLEYDPAARRVVRGRLDARKQDALYVRLGKNGNVASRPTRVSEQDATEAAERADRFRSFAGSLVDGKPVGLDYELIRETFRAAFEGLEHASSKP